MNLFSSKNLRLWLALSLFVLVALTACDKQLEVTAMPVTSPASGSRPVMQISQSSGMIAIKNPPGITNLILWDSGQAVFELDGVYREAHLAPSVVANLVDAAGFLYNLDNYVSAFRYVVTDAPSIFLTLEADQGHRKTVEVYGIVLDSEDFQESDFIDPSKIEILEKVQAFWKIVKDSLPETAPVMQPVEVVVDGYPPYGVDVTTMTLSDWPPELEGYLQGEAAQQAIRMAGLASEKLYLMGGEAYFVRVVPVLPILHDYRYRWERPRHPNATRYNIDDPKYGSLYRFSGVSQEEVASWYKAAMPELGWIMMKEEGADFQAWVFGGYDEYMLEFRFYPDKFYIQQIFVEQSVPRYPNSILGGCAGSWCQLLSGVTLDEAKAWFHEYMGYLGWTEKDTGVYSRSDGDVTEIIRFGFRTESGGIAVNIEEHQQIPPAWWPSPISTPTPPTT